MDASFHSAEWHAARIAALTTERLTWDEWKEQQKEHLMSEEAVVCDHLTCCTSMSHCILTAHSGHRASYRASGSSGTQVSHGHSVHLTRQQWTLM